MVTDIGRGLGATNDAPWVIRVYTLMQEICSPAKNKTWDPGARYSFWQAVTEPLAQAKTCLGTFHLKKDMVSAIIPPQKTEGGVGQ